MNDAHAHLQAAVETLQRTLADVSMLETLAQAAEATARALLAGKKLLVAGNGGSAADAQHLAAEFVVRLVGDRPAMRALALTANGPILTAASNDYGYEAVFSRQVEALGQEGDILIAISTSGNSPSILKAVHAGERLGLITVALTGGTGGALAGKCKYELVVPSTVTAHIQECHLALEHIFCAEVEKKYLAG